MRASDPDLHSLIIHLPLSLGLRFAMILALLSGALIGAAFTLGSKFLGGGLGPMLTGAAAGLFVTWLMLAALPWLAKQRFQSYLVQSQMRLPPTEAVFDAVRQVVKPYGQTPLVVGGRNNLLRIVTDHLFRSGARGLIFRLTSVPAEAPPLPEPLDVPIEPTPLGDARESFVDLRGERITSAQRLRHWWTVTRQMFAQRRWVWYLLLALMVFGWIALIVQGVTGVASLMRGRVSEEFWLFAFCAVIIGGYYLWRMMRPDRWYLVPGGLVLIDPTWFGKPWRVRLIPREKAILLYWMQGGQTIIATADAPPIQRKLTPWEFEMLARAWRSPLPPPPIEQVQAFCRGQA